MAEMSVETINDLFLMVVCFSLFQPASRPLAILKFVLAILCLY